MPNLPFRRQVRRLMLALTAGTICLPGIARAETLADICDSCQFKK